eukprot:10003944-Alexandrium_andersonii.AAC.1
MDLAREGRRPAGLVVQDLTDPRVAAPAVAWRGASDWFTHMEPGDACLLINWEVKPINKWSRTL